MTARRGGLLLGAYRAATILFGPAAGAFLRGRLKRGKEDPVRLGERMGHTTLARPAGRLAWVHGASVGEGIAVLPLVSALSDAGLRVLVTTGTVSSARVLADRLPPGALHQFVPLDVPAAVRRFLDHWHPDLGLLAESELWPNLIAEAHARAVPLALVNARMSQRSFASWRRLPGVIGPLLSCIDLCLAQSGEDGERYAALGAPHVAVAGNLKYDVPAPPADADGLAQLARAIEGRTVWLAASTHPDEEALLLDVHLALQAGRPGLLTIVVPRHAVRGAPLAEQAAARGLAAARRSEGRDPGAETQVYVADTMGELGLFYRLARVVFVGKSLGGGGGQNPIEPAKLGCAILHGPAVVNFTDVYRLLDDAGGAFPVADGKALADALARLLDDPVARSAGATAAAAIVDAQAGATRRIMDAVMPLLAPGRQAGGGG